jgi:hypothetical protein
MIDWWMKIKCEEKKAKMKEEIRKQKAKELVTHN